MATEHEKQLGRQRNKRYRARQKAIRLGLQPEPTIHVMNRTEKEKRDLKNQLDKQLRERKKSEDREEYLRKERERKAKLRQKNKEATLNREDAEKHLISFNGVVNSHYLNRYLNVVYHSDFINTDMLEEHHVLPKSIWPQYEYTKTNRVHLSVKAHFLAHWLLMKLLPDSNEMQRAFFLMSNTRSHRNIKSSKIYETARVSVRDHLRQQHADLFAKGTHPLQRGRDKQIQHILSKVADGTFHALGTPPWKSPDSTQNSLDTWGISDRLYRAYTSHPDIGWRKLLKHHENMIGDRASKTAAINMIKKFRAGWNPAEDDDWKEFYK